MSDNLFSQADNDLRINFMNLKYQIVGIIEENAQSFEGPRSSMIQSL